MALDPVNPKALKGKFKDREDKDIDNDGDTDSSDEYLHKRRQAVSKAIGKLKEEALEEKAKWRSSSAAKKITDPNNPDSSLADYDYHYENPRSTGRLKSTADTEPSYGSINNRRKSKINAKGDGISKADIKRVKSNAFNALKKEEVDLDEANILPSNFSDRTTPLPNKKAYALASAKAKPKETVSLKKPPFKIDEVSQELATRAYGRRSRDAAEYGDSGDDKEMNKSYDKGQKTLSIIKKKYGKDGEDKAKQQSSGLVYGGKKPYKEEVEELDELSKNTVRSYYNKAGEQGSKIAGNIKVGGGDWSKDGENTKTLAKRAAGRAMALKRRSGEVKMSEAKHAYTVAHKTFSSAVQHAEEVAKKRGFEIDPEEWDRKVSMGPRKPGAGKTNSYKIDLMKDGKEVKQKLNMQVYYDEGRYELNMYIS